MRRPEVTPPSNRELLQRWIDILNNADFGRMEELLDPEYVQEMPQSGERVHGIENMRQILLNYPGGWEKVRIEQVGASEGEARYLMTPSFNLVKVEGSGDMLAAYMRVTYPDGSLWYVSSIITFKNHKILKRIDFFGIPFDPPEWRSPWVQVVKGRPAGPELEE